MRALIVPPTINKYYALDLAPGRSLVEHLVQGGQQVFVISWRNPDARHRDWGADAYGQAILEAQRATRRICRADRSLVLGLCSGGILAAMVLAQQAAVGHRDRVAGFALAVTALDQARAGMAGAALDEATAETAIAASAARGFLDGHVLAEVFAWLRPGDLIWNYWVNNYLMGNDPPPFDLLHWNGDVTNLPGAWHRDYLQRLYRENLLVKPGAISVRGVPLDLTKIETPAYIQAGREDHIAPLPSVWKLGRVLGGPTRFVIAGSGHIAGVVNHPSAGKYQYWTNDKPAATLEEFIAGATETKGSWWPDWIAWLKSQSPKTVKATGARIPGKGKLKPIEDAPGRYVRTR